MKITRLESIFVEPRWHFLRVHTDEGIVGLGEPIVEGRARTVAMAIQEMEPYLLGQDPRQIEKHWQVLYRGTFYRGGAVLTSALSGVEQALWAGMPPVCPGGLPAHIPRPLIGHKPRGLCCGRYQAVRPRPVRRAVGCRPAAAHPGWTF